MQMVIALHEGRICTSCLAPSFVGTELGHSDSLCQQSLTVLQYFTFGVTFFL